MALALTLAELQENTANEHVAEVVASLHSPAATDFDKGAVHAAEVIAAKIRARRLKTD